jgi:hypothetical protein
LNSPAQKKVTQTSVNNPFIVLLRCLAFGDADAAVGLIWLLTVGCSISSLHHRLVPFVATFQFDKQVGDPLCTGLVFLLPYALRTAEALDP